MKPAATRTQRLARRIVAHESRKNRSSGTKLPAAFPAYEKLRAPLTALVGGAGFSALLSRALTLAAREVPSLRAAQVTAGGKLEGLGDLEAQVGTRELNGGRVALLARLLGLLANFIGADLTMHLVRGAWPALALGNFNLVTGDEHDGEE